MCRLGAGAPFRESPIKVIQKHGSEKKKGGRKAALFS
jgi:hypothetical protein